jgi:hypothetical protein
VLQKQKTSRVASGPCGSVQEPPGLPPDQFIQLPDNWLNYGAFMLLSAALQW